jgi:hypothetical protein
MTTPVYTCPQCSDPVGFFMGNSGDVLCESCHRVAVPVPTPKIGPEGHGPAVPQLITDLDVIELERMWLL